MPKVYGGEVREVGEITDFSSGVREAGKGFIYGYADAIFGVFREPVKGAKKEVSPRITFFFVVNGEPDWVLQR